MLKYGLVACLFLAGCSAQPKLVIDAKSSVPLESVEPLSTSLSEKEEYELALDVARLELKNRRYPQAETLLRKLKKYDSEDIRIYRLFRALYESQDQLEFAFVAAEQTLLKTDKQQKDEEDYARLALLLGKYQKADQIYQAWLSQADENGEKVIALNNLGFSALLQQKNQDAEALFRQALALDPMNVKARNNLKLMQLIN